ncbi:MAG: ABC transporter substrate-binding protein [Clostridia bacterium]|nr:ABC transporter substrate-binding protein [Clostridia bacterium]
MKRIITVFVAIALLVVCFASCGNTGKTNYAANNTEFYIGCSGPLTGDASVYGQAVKNSAQMAVDEINAAGGLNGVMFKFVMTDDVHKAENVSTNYTTMFESGMQIALGCVTTNPCLEFKTLSHEDNLFFITPSASSDSIVEYDNAYQMCFADGNQGKVAAEYVNGIFAGKTIGMLYRSDDAYSTGIREQFLANLDKSITVVEAGFSGGVVASFSSQINTLKPYDFIFMPIYYAPAAQFMTEAKNDVSPKATYYGCDGLDGIDTSIEGFDISTIPQEVSFLSHFNSKATEGASAEFIGKYVAKYGAETLNQFGASAYDCIYSIFEALKNCDVDVTSSPSEICEALKAVFQSADFSFDGVTGTGITWTKDGFVNKSAVKYIVKEAD